MLNRVLIADDHEIIRRGVMQRIHSKYAECRIHCVGSFQEAMKKLEANTYDVLVTDLKMEYDNPLTGVMNIIRSFPDTKVLVLSMYPQEYLAVRLMKRGVKGYVSKEASIEDILYAIEEVSAGKSYADRTLLSKLIGQVVDGETEILDRLSDRELEVFFLMINGRSLKEISHYLNLHHSSIGTYKRRIFDKLEVDNMVELTLFAVKHHLLA